MNREIVIQDWHVAWWGGELELSRIPMLWIYPPQTPPQSRSSELKTQFSFESSGNLLQNRRNKANLRDLIAATGQVISNWIQIINFSARVTVKFDRWPWKTIGHFFYTTSSFVHHFKSIGEFKLDLQSRNAQFGSKLVICYPVWPWNLMDDLGKQ